MKSAIHNGKNPIHGFAGTCDCMVDIQGEGPFIVDWKTSQNKRTEEMYESYKDQLGAYSLGLTRLTDIQPKGAVVVCARRSGEPDVKFLNDIQLKHHQQNYLERFSQYLSNLSLSE